MCRLHSVSNTTTQKPNNYNAFIHTRHFIILHNLIQDWNFKVDTTGGYTITLALLYTSSVIIDIPHIALNDLGHVYCWTIGNPVSERGLSTSLITKSLMDVLKD